MESPRYHFFIRFLFKHFIPEKHAFTSLRFNQKKKKRKNSKFSEIKIRNQKKANLTGDSRSQTTKRSNFPTDVDFLFKRQ